MGETEWAHVGLKVEQSKKEEWDEFLEGTDQYNNQSHLIRAAVQREITDDGGSTGGSPQGSRDDQRMGEVLQAVEKMAHRLNKLETRVNEATLTMHEAATDRDLTPDVYEALPEGKSNAVTAEQLADEIDAQPQSVAVVLARLDHNGVVERIDTTEKDHPEAAATVGETYWYQVK